MIILIECSFPIHFRAIYVFRCHIFMLNTLDLTQHISLCFHSFHGVLFSRNTTSDALACLS